MKTSKSIFIALLLLFVSVSYSFAQEITTTTGGLASGKGGSATYTVGQVIYAPGTGTTGSVDEVVQQPYEISDLTDVQLPSIQLYMAVYPNPVSDILILEVDKPGNVSSFVLYDASGKSLKTNDITATKTAVNMREYQKGFFFLKVYKNNSEIKSFKIIKK